MTSARQVAPALVALVIFVGTTTPSVAQPQSRSPADMPQAILDAQISRAATQAPRPVWVVSIWRGGDMSATATLRELIQTAYRRNLLDRPRVEGGPGWIGNDVFSINLKALGGDIVGDDGFPRTAMTALQELLSWRFKLSFHVEHRELPIYSLVVARLDGTLGPELRKSDVDCAAAVTTIIRSGRPPSTCGFQQFVGRPLSTVLTMADMASLFSTFLDRPVVDRTGLRGHFSVTLDGVEVRPPTSFDPGYRPDDLGRMFMAVTEQLGLRLEPSIGVVDVLVVDSAEDPGRSETLPLVVERTRVLAADPPRPIPSLEIVVRNIGDRTIVATGLKTEVTFADGHADRGGVSSDGIESQNLPARSPRARPLIIPPKEDYTFDSMSWSDRSERDVVSVKAEPTFVIFDDDTALGDEREIRYQFSKREDNYRAWPIIDRIFADALARTSDPREVLVASQTAVEAISDDTVRKSHAFRWTQMMLSSNLKIPGLNASSLLQSMLDEMHARRLATDAHHIRRN